jgi:hypothetical protein
MSAAIWSTCPHTMAEVVTTSSVGSASSNVSSHVPGRSSPTPPTDPVDADRFGPEAASSYGSS